jgi:hypothetical protein
MGLYAENQVRGSNAFTQFTICPDVRKHISSHGQSCGDNITQMEFNNIFIILYETLGGSEK